MHITGLFVVIFSITSFVQVYGQSVMQVLYNQRPPYLNGDDHGNVSGLTASVADYALRKAGILFKWIEIPSQRQLKMLQDNKGQIAAVGWFKNEEREKYCKYSVPIYRDKSIVLLSKKDNTKIKTYQKLGSFFLDNELVLLVKEGYSYGNALDERIKRSSIQINSTTVENHQMVRMIFLNRADCMFISPEEAEYVIQHSGLKLTDFQITSFIDMPEGDLRYILFSMSVNDQTVSEVNKYIDEYNIGIRY